jgi:hypothetical protein
MLVNLLLKGNKATYYIWLFLYQGLSLARFEGDELIFFPFFIKRGQMRCNLVQSD